MGEWVRPEEWLRVDGNVTVVPPMKLAEIRAEWSHARAAMAIRRKQDPERPGSTGPYSRALTMSVGAKR